MNIFIYEYNSIFLLSCIHLPVSNLSISSMTLEISYFLTNTVLVLKATYFYCKTFN